MNLFPSRRLQLAAVLLSLSLCCAAARAEVATGMVVVSGVVDKVAGSVKLFAADGAPAKIAVGAALPIGSQIETGANGKVSITWMKGATSVITENAKISVVSLGYSDNGGSAVRKIILRDYRGNVFSKLSHTPEDGKSSFIVRTDKGEAVASGTIWEVSVSDKAVIVSVAEDSILFTFANGLQVTIPQTHLFVVSIDGAPVLLTGTQLAAIINTAGGSLGPNNPTVVNIVSKTDDAHDHGMFDSLPEFPLKNPGVSATSP
jgi:hypothetical protein